MFILINFPKFHLVIFSPSGNIWIVKVSTEDGISMPNYKILQFMSVRVDNFNIVAVGDHYKKFVWLRVLGAFDIDDLVVISNDHPFTLKIFVVLDLQNCNILFKG